MTSWERRCSICGTRGSLHRFPGRWLCCDCYVKAGHEPAEHHPKCVAARERQKRLVETKQ